MNYFIPSNFFFSLPCAWRGEIFARAIASNSFALLIPGPLLP
ncbi:MAG: hypothetical protein ACRER2_17195 [Methylococcales bacterium]